MQVTKNPERSPRKRVMLRGQKASKVKQPDPRQTKGGERRKKGLTAPPLLSPDKKTTSGEWGRQKLATVAGQGE